jgi:Uncharacterized protein conserved in bacteria
LKQPTKRKENLRDIYNALSEKGYDPCGQLVGFLITGDPTYITNHSHARTMAQHLDRELLMRELISSYIGEQDTKN